MTPDGLAILDHLHRVAAERQRRAHDPALASAVQAIKHFQQARFGATYADLLAAPREGAAARFFLDDLYGPQDFSLRDAQFARIVPALVRLFPATIVCTVRELAQLHALSEELDTEMARAAATDALTDSDYVRAWQTVGRASDRERQLGLMLSIGEALDRYTRNPLLRHGLRAMRSPAQAAGLGALQAFLETGFETFRSLGAGARPFLDTIARRERDLFARLFAGDPMPFRCPLSARPAPGTAS